MNWGSVSSHTVPSAGDFSPAGSNDSKTWPRTISDADRHDSKPKTSRKTDLVARITDLARARNLTPGQLALAWVLAQGTDIVPIPGTTRRVHLEENVAAADIRLTPEERTAIDEVFPKGAARGLRYPEAAMEMLNR